MVRTSLNIFFNVDEDFRQVLVFSADVFAYKANLVSESPVPESRGLASIVESELCSMETGVQTLLIKMHMTRSAIICRRYAGHTTY